MCKIKNIYDEGGIYPLGTLRQVTGWIGRGTGYETEFYGTEVEAERALRELARNKLDEMHGKYDHVDNLIIEFDRLEMSVFGAQGRLEIAGILRSLADELEAGKQPFFLHTKSRKRVGRIVWR